MHTPKSSVVHEAVWQFVHPLRYPLGREIKTIAILSGFLNLVFNFFAVEVFGNIQGAGVSGAALQPFEITHLFPAFRSICGALRDATAAAIACGLAITDHGFRRLRPAPEPVECS